MRLRARLKKQQERSSKAKMWPTRKTALITGEQKLPPSVCSNSQRISQATTASTPILSRTLIKGFGLAEKAYGGKGKLPSVCYETYDKVIDMFDSWGKEKTEDKADGKDTAKVEAGNKSESSAQ